MGLILLMLPTFRFMILWKFAVVTFMYFLLEEYKRLVVVWMHLLPYIFFCKNFT